MEVEEDVEDAVAEMVVLVKVADAVIDPALNVGSNVPLNSVASAELVVDFFFGSAGLEGGVGVGLGFDEEVVCAELSCGMVQGIRMHVGGLR